MGGLHEMDPKTEDRRTASNYSKRMSPEKIDELSDDLMVLLYFIGPDIEITEELARETVGAFEQDKTKVKLKPLHFATLWLIELLTKRHVECLGTEVRNLLYLKHPTFERDRFPETVLAKLLALKLITYETISKQNKSTRVIKVTGEGEKVLGRLRRQRHASVRRLVDLLGIEKETVEPFAAGLERLGGDAWSDLKARGEIRSKEKSKG